MTDEALRTDPSHGLELAEAEARLATTGPNELPPPPREVLPVRILRQIREPMALLLLVAAAVAGIGLGERLQAVAILAIVVLNAVIGLAQEGKAARALEALRNMETPLARVRRGGTVAVVPSREVVPGDVVLLAGGDRVPADLLIVDAASLEVDESLLTGESLPVEKGSEGPLGPGGLESTAFAGTLVTRGSGTGIATATGPETELGAIARHLAAPRLATPLQVQLGALTARLGTVAVIVAAGVFGLTLLRTGLGEESLERAFLSAVALAVAAVPEGLATVVTVALALGVRRMATQGAIIRRLPAVETLGSTTVILTDKTGTLTENRMSLETVVLWGGEASSLEEVGEEAADRIAEVACLCNDAALEPPSGDRLEVALLEAVGAERVKELRRAYPRIGSVPFDSERKRMVTLHRMPGGVLLAAKGAPEKILPLCVEAVARDGSTRPLAPADKEALLTAAAALARRGVRVIALARRLLPEPPGDPETAERQLAFVALAGLRDPVRAEASSAVAEARSAGIHVVMVTGDHPGTATAIAKEVGLSSPISGVVTGAELRDAGLPPDPLSVEVYARVDPDQKLALVDSFRERGHVVAVTGDGVNDAPAMKRADIGVAMGRSGSDVAREAADMVVTDDNLATIVTAVREGRGIYDNIRKVVDYLVAGNLSEILVVVVALVLFPELGIPLLPLQLLWVNLLTDGLPAVALGLDSANPGLMARPPRRPGEPILGSGRLGLLLARGALIAAGAVGSLAVARFIWNEPWSHARALMFTVLVAGHLLYAFVARLPSRGLNLALLVGVAGGLLLQLLVVLWPAARPVFGTAYLAPREWALVAAGGILPTVTMVGLHGLIRSLRSRR
jgi:Ca2+-transporting ATPase